MLLLGRKRNHGKGLRYRNVTKFPRTLKVHKVLRTYNEDNAFKTEFYELADETDSFHIQWYGKEGDPENCGHNQLPLSYETDQTAKKDTKEMKSSSSVNCATSGFMKLVLKSNHFVVKFPCLYRSVLLFTVQWKLVVLIFAQNYLLKPTF